MFLEVMLMFLEVIQCSWRLYSVPGGYTNKGRYRAARAAKKLEGNIGSSCKVLVRIISCCPIPPQDQNFRIRCLPLVTFCVLRYSSFFGRLTKISPMLPCWLEQSNLHHFYFSGKSLQDTIIPDQSDIT